MNDWNDIELLDPPLGSAHRCLTRQVQMAHCFSDLNLLITCAFEGNNCYIS